MTLSTRLVPLLAIAYFAFHATGEAQQLQTPLEKLAAERAAYYNVQRLEVEKYRKKFTGLRYNADSRYLLSEITPTGFPIYKAPLNAEAAVSTGASTLRDTISLGLRLQGENLTVGVWDDGVVKDHIELGNRVVSKEGLIEQTHMTHVTGTIIASGVSSSAKGMAPKANATTWYFDNDDAEMAALAKSDQTGLLFSNHSYGTVTGWSKPSGSWTWYGDGSISVDEDYRHGFYGQTPQVIDQLAYLSPYYTIVWAAGNDRGEVGDGTHPRDGNGGTVNEGYDCIIPESVAKNIITVGAVGKVLSYTGGGSVVMSQFSSWGPTDDGRIKPDLVGAGLSIYSISAVGTNQYTTLSGTSMAAPNVTGSLMLLQELYSKLHAGNFMRASTLKGLAIHTTKEAGSFAGPDYKFGWGLLDVNAAAATLLQEDNENNFVKELTLNNGETYTQEINAQLNKKITVTICWTDPAGKPLSPALDPTTLMLVNDLDVRIVDDQGNTQFPWILNPGSPASQATTGDNFRDNVEKIEFVNPLAKKYTIRITHKGQLQGGSQKFSLIVTHTSSLTTGSNYYWIGNSGNWNDGAHWSLSTKGVASGTVPGANDNVIFDENSFNGVSTPVINLVADAACKRITWITDKPAALALNNHRLTIKSGISLSAKNLKIATPGFLRFESISDQSLSILKADLTKATLEFNGGNWLVEGVVRIKKMDVLKGAVVLRSTACSMKELNALANTSLDISNVKIDSILQSTFDGSVVLASTPSSTLTISSPAALHWNSLVYNGKIDVTENSQLEFLSSATVNELSAAKGAVLKLANGTAQKFNNVTLNALPSSVIKVESTGKASIEVTSHAKYCFDNLSVTNVDIAGNSIVNAGANSTITNASNWLREDCSNVLFSDFTSGFLCLNAFTVFTDRSSGNITSWSWNFGDEGSPDNVSDKRNPVHRFSSKGTFAVTLTVADGVSTRSFSKNVQITDNDQQQNNVITSGGVLLSAKLANNYQWYKDNDAIAGATGRSYNYNGSTGNFVVVTTGATCNYASQPFLVTATEELNETVQIYPNPATDYITLKLVQPSDANVILYDALGKTVLNQPVKNNGALDVHHIKDGIYILEINSTQGTVKRKVVIRHGE